MSHYAVLDDWQLLTAEGDDLAGIGALFERHKHYVFRLAWGFLADPAQAEDVTQEVFLRLANGRRRWRREAKFTTWLYRVTLNTCREARRRREREGRWHGDPDRHTPEPSAVPRAPFPGELARALARLPARQREAVVLRHLEGLSTRETATVMGCREGSVKTHLHRALGALRQTLAPERSSTRTTRRGDR